MSKNQCKIWFAENLVAPDESGFSYSKEKAEAFVVGMLRDGLFNNSGYPNLVTMGKAQAPRLITVHKAVAATLIAYCQMIRRSEEVKRKGAGK